MAETFLDLLTLDSSVLDRGRDARQTSLSTRDARRDKPNFSANSLHPLWQAGAVCLDTHRESARNHQLNQTKTRQDRKNPHFRSRHLRTWRSAHAQIAYSRRNTTIPARFLSRNRPGGEPKSPIQAMLPSSPMRREPARPRRGSGNGKGENARPRESGRDVFVRRVGNYSTMPWGPTRPGWAKP